MSEDDVTVEQARERLAIFFSHIRAEVSGIDWDVSSEQIGDLHGQLSAAYLAWPKQNDRHP